MVVTPVLCWCLGYLSVGINSSVFTTFLLGVFSQYYLRVYRPTWFRKYNYLMSAALDGGTQIMVFIATFAVFGARFVWAFINLQSILVLKYVVPQWRSSRFPELGIESIWPQL